MSLQTKLTHFVKIILITLSFFILYPAATQASPIKLAWDPNENPSPEGYKLFKRSADNSYDYDHPEWQGSDSTATVDCDYEDGCYFVVRAFDGADVSGDSNEVFVRTTTSSQEPGDESNSTPNENGDNDQSDGQNDGSNDGGSQESEEDHDSGTTGPGTSVEERANLTPVLSPDRSVVNSLTGHVKTRWQISTDAQFEMLVLDVTSESARTTYTVPDMILDTDEKYYWRALFIGDENQILKVSQHYDFTTIEAGQTSDTDSNGLPDHQEITDDGIDMDHNGVNDYLQDDMLCVKNASGHGQIGLKTESSHATLVSLKSNENHIFSSSLNVPEMTSMGIISFKLHLEDGETMAKVTVYFSSPAPEGARWFKYDTELGWQEYEAALFSEDRRSVTITLVDGGVGDEDGIRNGVIVDPSGLGFPNQTTRDTGSSVAGTDSASQSCFIVSANPHMEMVPLNLSNRSVVRILLFVALLIIQPMGRKMHRR